MPHPPEQLTAARVAVFAHTPVIAQGLSDLLRDTEGLDVVGATTEIAELVTLVVDEGARVVVTEVLNGSEDPSNLFDTIHSTDRKIGTPVTVVCVIPSPAGFALDLKRRGAAAVVTMTDEPESFRSAVMTATANSPVAPTVSREATSAGANAGLTARELDVLQGMVDGHSSRVIAEELGVSINTVRTHVQRLLPKLGAHNRLRAAAIAIERGLVTPTASRLRPPVGC